MRLRSSASRDKAYRKYNHNQVAEALQLYEEIGCAYAVHKQLNISLSNVKRWIKNHGRIYTPQKKKTRTVAYPDVEQELRSTEELLILTRPVLHACE